MNRLPKTKADGQARMPFEKTGKRITEWLAQIALFVDPEKQPGRKFKSFS
jgi:hypothetical protein